MQQHMQHLKRSTVPEDSFVSDHGLCIEVPNTISERSVSCSAGCDAVAKDRMDGICGINTASVCILPVDAQHSGTRARRIVQR